MTITAACPHCAAAFTFDDSQIGQAGSCPTCQGQIALAAPASPPAPAPSPQPAAASTPVAPHPAPTPASASPPRESRPDFIKRIRTESSYRAVRSLINVGLFLAMLLPGALCVGGIILVLSGSMPREPYALASTIGTIALSLLTALALLAFRQVCVVIFDIADVLIEARK